MEWYITGTDLCKEAEILKSEDGENKEYDRALCELIARVTMKNDMDTPTRAKEVAQRIGVDWSRIP